MKMVLAMAALMAVGVVAVACTPNLEEGNTFIINNIFSANGSNATGGGDYTVWYANISGVTTSVTNGTHLNITSGGADNSSYLIGLNATKAAIGNISINCSGQAVTSFNITIGNETLAYNYDCTTAPASVTSSVPTVSEVTFTSSATTAEAWTNMPVAKGEFGGTGGTLATNYTRTLVNFTNAVLYKLIVDQSVTGSTNSKLFIGCNESEWSLFGNNWQNLSFSNTALQINRVGTYNTSWQVVNPSCQGERYITVAGAGGDATADPAWRQIKLLVVYNNPVLTAPIYLNSTIDIQTFTGNMIADRDNILNNNFDLQNNGAIGATLTQLPYYYYMFGVPGVNESYGEFATSYSCDAQQKSCSYSNWTIGQAFQVTTSSVQFIQATARFRMGWASAIGNCFTNVPNDSTTDITIGMNWANGSIINYTVYSVPATYYNWTVITTSTTYSAPVAETTVDKGAYVWLRIRERLAPGTGIPYKNCLFLDKLAVEQR